MRRAAVTALLAVSALVFAGGLPEARAGDGGPPVFTRQPLPTAVPFGHTAVLTADTEFEPTLRWEWRRNGVVIPGAAASRLTLYNTMEEDTAEYHAVALSDAGARWSNPAAVIVQPPETAPGRVDETFTDPGFGGPVSAVTLRADDTFLVAGEFLSARGIVNAARLARLLPGGMPDPAFRPDAAGPDGPVYTLASLGNVVWAGGAFRNFDTAAAPCLVKLTPSGQRDAAFLPALPAGAEDVRVLVPLPDGRIYAGGRSRQGNTVSDWLVRLSADGSRDPAFTPPAFLNGRLRAVAARRDGRLWLGGNFFRPAGSAATYNRLALIESDGTVSPVFKPPAGADSGANLEVRCLQALPDGSVVAGGVFSKVNGLTRYGLARVLENGSADPSFAPPVLDDAVQTLATDSRNRIYAGGDFSLCGTRPVRSILRLLPDGTLDPDWQPPMGNGPVQTLLMTPAGLLTGGAFSLPRLACARLALESRARPPFGTAVPLPLTEPARLFRRTQAVATFPGPAAVPDQGAATFPISLTTPGNIEEIRIWLDIGHPDTRTLTLTLEPPPALLLPPLTLVDGARLRHGADFRRTLLSAQSPRPLSQAGPPCTDALQPAADLTVLTGRAAAGTWTLRITDNRSDSQAAALRSWTLEIFTPAARPDYRTWLGNRPATAGTFTSFAFGERYGQPPAIALNGPLFRLSHHGWPGDTADSFLYQTTTDLNSWQNTAPVSRTTTITPAETIHEVRLARPAAARAWWRAVSTRPAE